MAAEGTILERLSRVQLDLKAPKSQFNSFGKYNYRNVEDILEAVKPLLEREGLNLTLDDELVQIGERYYIKARAEVNPVEDPKPFVRAHGYAREEEDKKGMDGSQITGAASSYARKYALNGLFLIDDTKDSDATNDHGRAKAAPKPAEPLAKTEPTINAEQIQELMSLAKKKGAADKQAAIAFLNTVAAGTFTNLPQSEFDAFKKKVITEGWKQPEVVES